MSNSQDIAKLKASTDKYGKQIKSQREYLTVCRTNLNASLNELNGLLADIKVAGLEDKLNLFIANKDYEMELYYSKVAREHCNKLNVLFKTEMDHLKDALMLSCDLNQQFYLQMRGNNIEFHSSMQEQQDRLLKLIEGKSNIKFSDDNLQDSLCQLSNLSKESDIGGSPEDLQSNVTVTLAGKKRRNLFDIEADEQDEHLDVEMEQAIKNRKLRILDFPPVPMFNTVIANMATERNINETVVVQSGKPTMVEGVEELNDNFNSTFQMPTKSTTSSTVNMLTKNVLTEQNLNKIMNQPNLMSKVVVKSKVFANQRDTLVRAGRKINGDNVRFSPSRVGKSNGRMPVRSNKSKSWQCNFYNWIIH